MSDHLIKDSIQEMAGTKGADNVQLYSATVDSVDILKRTCNVTAVTGKNIGSVEDVNLMAALDDGILLVPTVGSTVGVLTSVFNDHYVVSYSELDSITLIAGHIQLNDGSYNGLVIGKNLVTRLNTLENDLNTIKTAFKSWSPVPNDGGAALKIAAAAWTGQTITKTKESDIENTTVTHGI